MKIFALEKKIVLDLDIDTSKKEYKSTCPICSSNRKKKNDKCFSYYPKDNRGVCHHCEERFIDYKPFKKVDYILPIWKDEKELPEEWITKIHQKRYIGKDTLDALGICSKRKYIAKNQREEDCIAFPYKRGNIVVNCKYRGANKGFSLEGGAELIWYNYNAILDEVNKTIEKNEENNELNFQDKLKYNRSLIITEGEWDAASFYQEGYKNVVSVPNGANVGDMTYFDSSIDLLEKIDSFYLAVDNDEKGIILRNELIRRLGAYKCYIVKFDQYKDANEYLIGNGYGSLTNVLENAKHPTVDGVFSAEDMLSQIESLFQNGLQKGALLDIYDIDKYISWTTAMLCIVSGVPQSGKSEFVDFLVAKLNVSQKWKAAYYTAETVPTEIHYARIFQKIIGTPFKQEEKNSSALFWNAYEHINKNFFWVNPDEVNNVDELLDKFLYFVKVKGIKIVVLDPFNKLASGVEYNMQGQIINKCSKFSKKYNVLFILVMHPRKISTDSSGVLNSITPYDIAGTSDAFNMCDYMVLLEREQDPTTGVFIDGIRAKFAKVKFTHLGHQGMANLEFDKSNGRYSNDKRNFNNNSWINTNNINNIKINNTQIINNFETPQNINPLDVPF